MLSSNSDDNINNGGNNNFTRPFVVFPDLADDLQGFMMLFIIIIFIIIVFFAFCQNFLQFVQGLFI